MNFNCKTLEQIHKPIESRSSLESLKFTAQSTKNEFEQKQKIFISIKKNTTLKNNKSPFEYLEYRQEIFLKQLLEKNPEIVIISDKEKSDFLVENEYYENENSFSLAMIFKQSNSSEIKKYFFTIKISEQEKQRVLLYRENKEVILLKNFLPKWISFYEEPLAQEILNFLKSCLYGKVYFYSNLPNVKVECNKTFLGKVPVLVELVNGKYECKFTSNEGISKWQRFYLSPKQELKVYQSFFESKTSSTLFVDALPEVHGLGINERFYSKLPVVSSWKEVQKISFHNSEKYIEFQINKFNFETERESNWLIFPYMVWDAFHPRFLNFWEEPKSFGTSLEMNRYLSVINKTKMFLNEWSFLESKPFFPESILIEGGFFPQEDTGTGIFQIHFGTFRDYYTIEVEEERVSLFHFPSFKISIGNYLYSITEDKKPRKFSIKTEKDSQTISIYLDEKRVLVRKFNFNSPWKLILSFKGAIFNRLNVLNHLKIAYPDFLNENEQKIWNQSGYFD